ncbi:hypothetical protein B0H17DRAFT_1124255 [Mycena rosella]|uniref:RNase III domain-containing protein n=1 Tax=Mycena rosella TaxID=1033263 RepID=A0AAD7H1I2_MYCRO|nr:hypothetical protein B0H17DRAFT_1124255 [Mycena rosella]
MAYRIIQSSLRQQPRSSAASHSRMERERLEICGDALLGKTLVYHLYQEFPSQGAGFISIIKAALLSNHVSTNISLKAQGYSDPNGFPVDKAIADDFEALAALSKSEKGSKAFKLWFRETFISLADAAASRPDIGSRKAAALLTSSTDPRTSSTNATPSSEPSAAKEAVPMKAIANKSWVESCMELAALDPIPAILPVWTTEISRRRRRREDTLEEQPLPKRRWAEAMEAAAQPDDPPRSSWVEAIARSDLELTLPVKNATVKRDSRHTAAKENCRPMPSTESRRRKTRWDAPISIEPQAPPALVPSAKFRETDSPFLSTNNTLGLSGVPVPISPLSPELTAVQAKNGYILSTLPTPSSPIRGLETGFERDPLHIDRSASLVQYPPPDSTTLITNYRAETCSPMEMSPNCSPTTKFIGSTSLGERHRPTVVIRDTGSPAPFFYPPATERDDPAVFHVELESDFFSCNGRPRSESFSSTCSSPMAISACSSPTKFLFPPVIFGQESPPTPTKQPSLDIRRSPRHRGQLGASQPSSDSPLSRTRCPPIPPHAGTHTLVVVAQGSAFWPGKTVSFAYKQHQKALQPALNLD